MPDLAIYELAAVLLVIPLSYSLSYLVKYMQRNSYEDELRTLFNLFWNGTEEDELYAWYKVRMILTQRDDERRKIRYVNRKIEDLNKQVLYSATFVDPTGRLISKNEDSSIKNQDL